MTNEPNRGQRTQVEVGGLGPEECYHFRVGVTIPGEDTPTVWSKIVPANTKDDLILVANLHRSVQYGNARTQTDFFGQVYRGPYQALPHVNLKERCRWIR
ncbi:hypothetical protein J6590_062069 [Homalodisca vitripennis]|nr:hypothetical protein J6590_062069 [Homalodisca vitripennis]